MNLTFRSLVIIFKSVTVNIFRKPIFILYEWDRHCKVKETLLIQELAVKRFFFIRKAFTVSLYRKFPFETSYMEISTADVFCLDCIRNVKLIKCMFLKCLSPLFA